MLVPLHPFIRPSVARNFSVLDPVLPEDEVAAQLVPLAESLYLTPPILHQESNLRITMLSKHDTGHAQAVGRGVATSAITSHLKVDDLGSFVAQRLDELGFVIDAGSLGVGEQGELATRTKVVDQ